MIPQQSILIFLHSFFSERSSLLPGFMENTLSYPTIEQPQVNPILMGVVQWVQFGAIRVLSWFLLDCSESFVLPSKSPRHLILLHSGVKFTL